MSDELFIFFTFAIPFSTIKLVTSLLIKCPKLKSSKDFYKWNSVIIEVITLIKDKDIIKGTEKALISFRGNRLSINSVK
jgi:hypothetical protein